MCWVTHVILSFFLLLIPTAAHTMERTRGQEKNRIEIHFVSLGRNGKMDDRVLK